MAQTVQHGAPEIIRALLVQLGVAAEPAEGGVQPAWPAYADVAGDDQLPDQVVTVLDQANAVHGRVMLTGRYVRHFGVQVMVRSPRQAAGAAKADAIFTALAEDARNVRVTVTDAEGDNPADYVVVAVSRVDGPIPLGREPTTGRRMWSINAQAAIRLDAND